MSESAGARLGRHGLRDALAAVAVLMLGLGVLGWIAVQPPLPVERPAAPSSTPERAPEPRPVRSELERMHPEQPPIVDPPVTLAELAGSVQAGDLVLGLAFGPVARAYPLDMLSGPAREVLNDTLVERRVVISWCPLCHHAAVFDRELDGQALTFGVAGAVWRGNLVLYDQQSRSHWSQLLGLAIEGPLRGRRLTPIPAIVTDWETWRSRYPKTSVLQLSRTSTVLKRGYYNDLTHYVLGIAEGGQARAWPFEVLADRRVLNTEWQGRPVLITFERAAATARLFERTLPGVALSFHEQHGAVIDEATGSTWDPITGAARSGPLAGAELTPLPGVVAFRSAWLRLHPESAIESPPRTALP